MRPVCPFISIGNGRHSEIIGERRVAVRGAGRGLDGRLMRADTALVVFWKRNRSIAFDYKFGYNSRSMRQEKAHRRSEFRTID